ncbi:hypothetical protein [Promicromonospora sp. NFX87]|uniref:hypothetical protein n=1 Tax=Promicromonospora sp. NFX87 TaxID=3402691 RepID=UPI003AFB2A8B
MTTVTTVTDLATPPLWHARRVTAGAASGVTEALEALRAFGLMPDQLAGESAHLLDLNDFDKARALLEENEEEESMATDLDTAPSLDMNPSVIRAWAKTRGLRVASMGMVPRGVVDAYIAADGVPGTAPVRTEPTDDEIAAEIDAAFAGPDADQDDGAPVEESATVTEVDLRRQLDRLGVAYSALQAELAEAQHDAETVRAVLLTTEEQRNQARVEANRVAVELAEALEGLGEQARQAAVVSTLPGPLPEEILELLAAWHALFAKATEVDTAAGHTLAEVALPALVLEAADQAHDLVRLLDGDVSR